MTRPGHLALFAVILAAALTPASAEELAGAEAPFQVVEIGGEGCAALATYLPNGEADYKPGVAADGSAVAPADLGGGYGIEPRTQYTFQVRIAPLGAANPKYSPDSSFEVATVEIDTKTGRVSVDGAEVSGAGHALAEACARQRRKSGD
ncbi:MAG: hypothetical protein WBG82_00905 [Parvibaculum sp.]|uniref:hypothetical protein n=1 Tax=Parvibaculum sp. TaxID=2024848 RepID=UPI003C72F71B